MIYRKSVNSDIWHCCRNCRHWPEGKGVYAERNSKPVSGKLYERCELMMREGDCTPQVIIRVSSVRVV